MCTTSSLWYFSHMEGVGTGANAFHVQWIKLPHHKQSRLCLYKLLLLIGDLLIYNSNKQINWQ